MLAVCKHQMLTIRILSELRAYQPGGQDVCRGRGFLSRSQGPQPDRQGRRHSIHLRWCIQFCRVHAIAFRTCQRPQQHRWWRVGPNAGFHDRFLYRLLVHGRRLVVCTAILGRRDKVMLCGGLRIQETYTSIITGSRTSYTHYLEADQCVCPPPRPGRMSFNYCQWQGSSNLERSAPRCKNVQAAQPVVRGSQIDQ